MDRQKLEEFRINLFGRLLILFWLLSIAAGIAAFFPGPALEWIQRVAAFLARLIMVI